jgi:hypothetical protein
MYAALLNYGMHMDAVCIDSIVAPFGRRTVKGLSDLILFLQGALIKMKWPVHTDSTMDVSCCLRSGGVQYFSNILLLFKVDAPSHHSLIIGLPPMLSALVASRLCPCLGKLQLRLICVLATL